MCGCKFHLPFGQAFIYISLGGGGGLNIFILNGIKQRDQ